MKEWSFIDHITESMSHGRTGDPRPPTLWPSEASAVVTVDDKKKVLGQCRRRTFFRYMLSNYQFYDRYQIWKPLAEEIKRSTLPPEPYLLWIWKQGDLYEAFVSDQSKRAGVFLDDQVAVYIPEFNISGKEDLEVINPLTKKIRICEVKSVYGYGGNEALGTPSMRAKGLLGKPKDNNLMQISLYDWWHASCDPSFEESCLVYGSRDTGRYGEYLVDTTPTGEITYKPVGSPTWTSPLFTIDDILKQYKNQQLWLDTGFLPDRDFDLLYSEAELAELAANDELNKTEREKYDKVIARREENKELLAAGKKPKTELKQIEKGCWQCSFCPYKNICYDKESQPRTL